MIELTQGSTASGKVLYLGQKTYSRLWYAQECKLERMDNLCTDGYDPLVCPHKSGLMLKRHGFENGDGHIIAPADLSALICTWFERFPFELNLISALFSSLFYSSDLL